MMQRIRERTAGWFAGGVIVVIGIVFALMGVYGYLGEGSGEKPAMTVNGEDISKQKFQEAYRRESAQNTKADERTLKENVTEALIIDTLRLQDAANNNFRVGGNLVDNFIASAPELSQNGQFSPELFNQFLNKIGQTRSAYTKLVHDSLAQYYMQIGLIGSEFVLADEVKRDFAITDQKRSLAYATFPIKNYLEQVTVTDEQIQAFYKQHQEKFISPEKVSVQYVILSNKDLAGQITADDSALKQYYDEHQDLFKSAEERRVRHILLAFPEAEAGESEEALQQKAQDILAQLKSGADFSELAQKYSDDVGSAQQGGELGWLPRGAAVKPFEEVVFSTKAGDISQPFTTDFGIHIVKVEEVKPESIPAFDKVKEEVKKEYVFEKSTDEFAQKQEELAQLVYENPKSLAETAKKLALPLTTSPLFSQQGSAADEIVGNPAVVAAAFNEAVLAGNNSAVITLVPNEKVIALRIAEHVPQKEESLEAVKPEVTNIVKYELASKLIKEKIQEALASLKTTSLNDVATQLNLSVSQATEVGRFEFSKLDPALLRYAFAMPKPSADYQSIGETQLTNGDFVLIQLQNVIHPDPNQESKMMLDAYANNLTQLKSQLDYELYASGLRNTAEIKYY